MRRTTVLATVAVAATLAAGCGGDGEAYGRDDDLRLNHIQALGTHNSYHQLPPGGATEPAVDYAHAPLDRQLDEQGVRQLELDVHWSPADQQFHVRHSVAVDTGTSCDLLDACLAAVRTWSDANPGHLPLVILLEPKDDPGAPMAGQLDALDAAVVGALGRQRVITPDEVQGERATLADAVERGGWPTLGATRGRVLLALVDVREHREAYTRGGTSLRGRAMFSYSEPGTPLAAFMSVADPLRQGNRIRELVRAGYLVRTRADVDGAEARAADTTRLEAALASGAHFVSTDYPVPHASGYVAAIPDGQPARCNPISAPDDCESTDIEDPDARAGDRE